MSITKRARALAGVCVVAVAAATLSTCSAPQQVSPGRYVQRVFGSVEKIVDGAVYRTTVSASGQPTDFRLDVYAPAGDNVAYRPAVIWMFGGGWSFGDRNQLAAYAQDSALRGYLGVTIDYHITSNATPAGAPMDAFQDVTEARNWLAGNATANRIDGGVVIAAGYSAGAFNAINSATLAASRGVEVPVAGIVAIAGGSFAPPRPGLPPLAMFGASDDTVVPFASQRATCDAYLAQGNVCHFQPYSSGGHGIAFSQMGDIQNRTAYFLATQVLTRFPRYQF
jgi:acetyl esterase/lipase